MWAFTFCNNVVRFQDWILRRKRYIPKEKASKGERAVAAVLEKHGLKYSTQYELGYYVHADFAIYHKDKLYIVEYDGRQHYHPVKFFGGRWRFFLQRWRDSLEKLECQDRGMPLLRIRYDLPFEEIEPMLMEFLTT